MTNREDLIELAECELASIIDRAHKSGLSYRQVRTLLLETACKVDTMAETEYEIRKNQSRF